MIPIEQRAWLCSKYGFDDSAERGCDLIHHFNVLIAAIENQSLILFIKSITCENVQFSIEVSSVKLFVKLIVNIVGY